jgi:hypothetical protein
MTHHTQYLNFRNVLKQLDLKEKEFFSRLSAHRPKELKLLTVPGRGEVTLPDYYGEKVNSIWDYKKWVQKQVFFFNFEIF